MSRAALAVLMGCGLTVAVALPASAQPERRVQVILRLQAGADVDANARQAVAAGGRLKHVYRSVLSGYAVELPERAVAALQRLPQVVSVEPDLPVQVDDTQNGAVWGLDRIDQRARPVSGTYTYPGDGAGVNAYIIDTGILANHTDFGGRVRSGYTAIPTGGTTDCHGHGTHVAGTVAGRTYGVAKAASAVAIRVLDCAGSGFSSGLIAGLDWAAADHAAGTPAVANLSLSGGASTAVDNAVQGLVNDGVSVVVAAGNDNVDACTQSPARAPAALTVAASTTTDARASFSNFGTCTDLFAPGVGIQSDWYTGTTATATLSGTSMAAPHVAGAAAVALSQQNGLTPAAVTSRLLTSATPGVITGAGAGTPNRLLFVEAAAPAPMKVTAPGNRTNHTGSAVSLAMTATGGTAPYTWSATGLPAGLTINPTSGVITGTPTAVGSGPVTVTATGAGSQSAFTTFTWNVTAPPFGCSGSQKLINPGFESGATSWSASGGVITQPGATRPARTGTWTARLGGRGAYVSTVLSQPVAIPAGCNNYALSFWVRVDTAETSTTSRRDTLAVALGTTTVATYSNLDSSAGYVQKTVDIKAQAGRTVTLKFTSVEDAARQTSFSVDDVAVTAG